MSKLQKTKAIIFVWMMAEFVLRFGLRRHHPPLRPPTRTKPIPTITTRTRLPREAKWPPFVSVMAMHVISP